MKHTILADYEYIFNVENVDAQVHSSEPFINTWENNVNICRVVRKNPAPKIDNNLVPKPPEICKSKG